MLEGFSDRHGSNTLSRRSPVGQLWKRCLAIEPTNSVINRVLYSTVSDAPRADID
jgi:hypothetical protein